jgi:polyisoprenoid-binding protein YceI
MKKSLLLLFSVLALVGFSFTDSSNKTAETLVVDAKASYIKWTGYKVTGKHWGTVKLKSGALEYKDGLLAGGNFVIDMASIGVDDLQGNGKERLEGHLKSDDFFGVEKFPTAKFVITQVISRGTPGSYRITGDLTIKESTKSIRFNADIAEEGGKHKGTAKMTIDRSDYNVRFGSGSFFSNLGDKTIYDEFDLEVNLVAGKSTVN